ncbi:MAG: hypothetical protein PHR77_13595 [Kiritimatiellae bacterium]|nr:hypothetical protein [Kiritimatiellia bacterium]MDD5520742.1 hypothetical protein [Kiritimatiellia bacterium]
MTQSLTMDNETNISLNEACKLIGFTGKSRGRLARMMIRAISQEIVTQGSLTVPFALTLRDLTENEKEVEKLVMQSAE